MIKKTFDLLSPECEVHGMIFSAKAIKQMARKVKFPLPIWLGFDCTKPVGIIQSAKYDKKKKMLIVDCLLKEELEEKLKLGASIKIILSHRKNGKEIIKKGELIGAGLSENASAC